MPDRRRGFFSVLREGLIAFAEYQFWLSRPEEDGEPLREHLLAGERQGHEPSRRYLREGPCLPAGGEGLWAKFLRLHNRRGGGAMGPGLITWQDIDAFQAVTGFVLLGFEVEMIEALDNAWIKISNDKGFNPFEKEEEGG